MCGGTGVPEKLVLALIDPTQANYADPGRVGVEGLRAACRGARVLVERQMKSVFLPALLCVLGGGGGGGAKGGSSGDSGDSGDSGKGGKYDACAQANMFDEKVPASVAAALAMYRSESCFADWNVPQDSRRCSTNNPTPQLPHPTPRAVPPSHTGSSRPSHTGVQPFTFHQQPPLRPPTLAVSAPCPMMRRAASAVRDAERKMLRLPSGL